MLDRLAVVINEMNKQAGKKKNQAFLTWLVIALKIHLNNTETILLFNVIRNYSML